MEVKSFGTIALRSRVKGNCDELASCKVGQHFDPRIQQILQFLKTLIYCR